MKKILTFFLTPLFLMPMLAHADDLSTEDKAAIQAELKYWDYDPSLDSIGLDTEYDFTPGDLKAHAEYIEWRHDRDTMHMSWVPAADKVFESVYDATRNVYRMTPRNFMNTCVNSLIAASPRSPKSSIRETCAYSLIDALQNRLDYRNLSNECRIDVNKTAHIGNLDFYNIRADYAANNSGELFSHDMTKQVTQFMHKYTKDYVSYYISYAQMAHECENMLVTEIAKIRKNPGHPQYHDYKNPISGDVLRDKCEPLMKGVTNALFTYEERINCSYLLYDREAHTFWKTSY